MAKLALRDMVAAEDLLEKPQMNETSGLLLAYVLDGKGGGRQLALDELAGFDPGAGWLWAHFDATHPDARRWLEQDSGLDPFVVSQLLSEMTRPRLVEIDDGALLNLRGINLNEGAEPEDMVSIRIWIGGNRVISARLRRLKAVADVEERIEKGTGPKSGGELVAMLSARLLDRMEPTFRELDEVVDDAEEEVIEKPDMQLRERLVEIRRRAIVLRRYIAPQRDAIGVLRMSDLKWLDISTRRNLQDGYDRLSRFVEELDLTRERAQIIHDELKNAMADKLNRNMYVLSIVAAIFLPLGFLTGLFGINVGGIPGAEIPDAFLWFSGLLIAIVAVQVLLFRWFRWF